MEQSFQCADILKLKQLEGVILLAGREGLAHDVTHVNVMEVPDVVNWVRPGEFLMTTGYPFRSNPEALVELIPSLAQKGIAALGIKTKRFLDSIPDEALRLADAYRLPLFELPPHTVFSDVQREVMEQVLINEARELTLLQSRVGQITKLLLEGSALEDALAELESIFGNPVLLTDGSRILGSERNAFPAGTSDRQAFWNEVKETCGPGLNRIPIDGRQVRLYATPLNPSGRNGMSDFLILVEWNSDMSTLDFLTMDRVGVLIGLEMMNVRTRREVAFKYIDQFLHDWLSGRVELESDLRLRAEAIGCTLADDCSYTAILVRWLAQRPDYSCLHQGLQSLRMLRWNEQGIYVTLLHGELVLIVSHAETQSPPATLLESITAAIERCIKSNEPFSLCLGKSTLSPESVHESYLQAKKVHAISQVTGSESRIVTLEQLGAYQLLYLLSEHSDARAFRDKYTLPLLQYETKHDTKLLYTLKVYFSHNQNVRKTAEALFTHYNTVVHRLDRVNEILQLRMDNAEERLQLELAVKLYYMNPKNGGLPFDEH